MEIIKTEVFRGRNIYSHRPVIRAAADLGELYDTPTRQISGFNERLLRLLPGLANMSAPSATRAASAKDGRGDVLAHVAEHMVLELQSLLGYDVHYGKSRTFEKPEICFIIFEYKNEKAAVECLLAATDMINMLVAGKVPDIGRIMEHLKRTAAESDLGPSTEALYEEARRRGIPVMRLENSSILRLGTGKYTRHLEASLSDSCSCVAVDIAGNKHLTKLKLSEAGIPVPPGDVAYTCRSAAAIASAIGWPIAVKPFDANQGKGVFTNITSFAELENAFNAAVKYSHAVIVEKHIEGKDYRLLIAGGEMAAAAERKAPCVTGNGIHTIRELVEIENKNPLRGDGHEKPLTAISLDDFEAGPRKNGYSEDSIPERRGIAAFFGNPALADCQDCTDEVHPHNAAPAEKAAN